ncbi:MAG: tetratricopeptide repeat protein [Nitrosospira sp.]
MVAISALFISVVWLIIEDNLSDHYGAAVSQTGPEQPAISDVAKPNRDPAIHLGTANSLDAGPFNSAQITAGAKPAIPPTQKRLDDHHFAVQLYQESAENGDSDAQYKLGLLYLTGNGALQDFAEAAKWLKLSAEQGYALAQYELGLIYRTGYGLATDQVQSYMWLNLAAAAGVKQAVLARDEVMKSLNTKQLAQAQKNSRDWLASRPKPKPHKPDPPETTNGVQPATAPFPLAEPDRKQRK